MSATLPILSLPETLRAAPRRAGAAQPQFTYAAAGKRAFDFASALFLLVLFSPFLVAAAIAVEATTPGPAFYVQWRVGRRGRLFRMFKLRSMVADAESRTGPVWAQSADPRVTTVGRFLRATHLDELPQLWNVLKGEMSLVGPRPERPVFVQDFTRSIPCYAARHEVLPGITGLAQVRQGPDQTVADVRRKLRYDLLYVRRLSFAADLKILAATLRTAVPAGSKGETRP